MKLWLDDERPAPDAGWTRVTTASEAIEILSSGRVEEASLDHDLGPAAAGTGYDVIKYVELLAYLGGKIPQEIRVHSANPVAREKMLLARDRALTLSTGYGADVPFTTREDRALGIDEYALRVRTALAWSFSEREAAVLVPPEHRRRALAVGRVMASIDLALEKLER